MGLSNLPPGVTQGMIDEHFDVPDECEQCDEFDDCPYDLDLHLCKCDKEADAAEQRMDMLTDL